MSINSSRQDPLVSDDTRQLIGSGNADHPHGASPERWPQHQWPREIGSNVIVGKLGEGGAAIVFEAIHKEKGQKRALKVLFPDCSQDDRLRFEQEIALSSQLQHSNTIGAIEFGEWERLPFLVMKRVEGRTLTKVIQENEKLPATVVAAIGMSAASTLAYCHSLTYTLHGTRQTGMLHRDIKPANMMVGNDGELYVTDFSIATPVSMGDRDDNPYGSVPYFAPEIINERSADQRSDIFSLGCTLYEALSGVRAFDADDIDALMKKRKDHQHEQLKALVPSAPSKLIELITRCMAFDPDERPESMLEVEKQFSTILRKIAGKQAHSILESFVKGRDTGAKPSHTFSKIGIGLGILSVAAIVFGMTYSPLREKIGDHLPWKLENLDFLSFKGNALFGNDSENQGPEVPDGPQTTSANKGSSSKQVSALPPQKQITFSPHRRSKKSAPATKERQRPNRIQSRQERTDFSVESRPERNSIEAATGPISENQSQRAENNQPQDELTLTEQLMEKHGTNDMLEVLRRESAAQHYENVLIILDEFPEKQRRSPLAQIHRIRAMDATGRLTDSFINTIDADDGEIHIIKAKQLFKKGDYEEAINHTTKAQKSPVMLLDRSTLEKRASLLEARSRSALFRNSPNESTRTAAMETWVQVKSAFRDERSSPVIAEANQAIRELIKAQSQLNTVEQ